MSFSRICANDKIFTVNNIAEVCMSFTYGKKKIGIEGPLTSFNEVRVAQMTPISQGDFVYNINDRVITRIEYAGGTTSQSAGLACVESSTSSSGSAALQLNRALKYQSGQGAVFRGTALFTTGTSGNIQILGVGNGECGYFFGYLQENFGILHQPTSAREIRALTVTAGSTTGNVTVTLNGDSIVLPITGAADVTQTAFQLSQADYTQLGNGWEADAVSGTVYFLSSRAQPLDDGAYSVAGSSIAGTFSRIQTGVLPTSTFISQSAWNLDTMDGRGPSGMTLDPTKGNVYEIGFQYLGFGNAFFSIEDQDSGRPIPVHIVKNTNSRTTPVLRNPNLSGFIASSNIPGGAGINVPSRSASLAVFIEGTTAALDPKYGFSRRVAYPDTNNVWKPVQAFKVNRVHNSQSCFGEMDLISIGASNETGATSPKSYRLGIFVDEPITGDVNFQNIELDQSIISTAQLNPSSQSFLNADINPVFAFGVNGGNSILIDLAKYKYVFGTGRLIVIAVNSDDAINGGLSLNWYEQQ